MKIIIEKSKGELNRDSLAFDLQLKVESIDVINTMKGSYIVRGRNDYGFGKCYYLKVIDTASKVNGKIIHYEILEVEKMG